MAIEDRRERERSARRRLIVSTARQLAESEGWDAVTTRRLSTEIEYSQPVLYKHFTGMEQIADAVALEGFGELAEVIRGACADDDVPANVVLNRIAQAYLDFAHTNPAVYEAMFTRATALHFSADDTPAELLSAFAALHQALARVGPGRDVDTLTEVFWAALHGLVTLGATRRLRPDHVSQRVRLLVEHFTGMREPTAEGGSA
ncbi:MAG: TetR/AcrR family transcriptional regulator [Actinomycetota bacterium]|uniref:TetR/AcrR family transcriptional regulator n=1 Tax=Mycobacterium lentiflavum TaxID=141349 RepID=A0ABY3UST2_MYCLN|nr:TetR/AcrR family transcriptional regulator [Mycobacterium lentiflavum]MEE3065526.1 TetR/AcrR family transcriptional regulator [Actinomycetota bacterium]ULP42560.1 TetR/AcrR family transcriptional regulator [Mycobacterium lentiflavum]